MGNVPTGGFHVAHYERRDGNGASVNIRLTIMLSASVRVI